MPASSSVSRAELLRSAPLNSWVALSEDESSIVAVASTYEEAVRKSEEAGVSDPVLTKTPEAWAYLLV